MRSLVNQSIVSSGIKAPGPIENKIAWLTLLFFFLITLFCGTILGKNLGSCSKWLEVSKNAFITIRSKK